MTAVADFKVKPVVGGGHGSNRLARQQLIVWLYRHASQSRQDHIVAGGDLQDQHLSGPMVRAGIKNLAIGRGDYLPAYAGNLDIINCAAIAAAERFARQTLQITPSFKVVQ